MQERVPMTREGYEKLKADLDRLKEIEMPRVTERIGIARGFGDLSENAEYHAAREEQAQLHARIVELESRIAAGIIVDPSHMPTDQVAFGARVRVKDLTFDEEEEYHLVGQGEEDLGQNKILITSPVGKALAGKKVGEVAEVKVPAGVRKLQVLHIAYG